MATPKIEPSKITRPFQLLAVWIAGLIILVGIFVGAAAKITNPAWLPVLFSITAVTIVPLFALLVFVMQTKFRPQLQDDPHFSKWLEQQQKVFRGFRPENIDPAKLNETLNQADLKKTALQGEELRVKRYEENRGLFLVHRWRPSLTPDQVADIVIELRQHRDGPLNRGNVESVTYYLGVQS